jgi:hypothetical protein
LQLWNGVTSAAHNLYWDAADDITGSGMQRDQVSGVLENTNFTQTFQILGPGTSATPLPATLPLFATGLGALGLLGWHRKRKKAGLAAA